MPKISLRYKRIPADEAKYGKGYSFNSISQTEFQSFNSSSLGLGDISQDGRYIQAIAAFYDLEGFTSFSNQVDSHLVIPEFLKSFIEWLFLTLREKFKENESNGRVMLWSSLPFYTKFLGDGILFLWDTENIQGPNEIPNLAQHLHAITKQYGSGFLPDIKKHVSKPPSRLRCGMARGQIISIGQDSDYVGSCINIASRLQKLSTLSFAISRRGFNLPAGTTSKYWHNFILKRVELRGIGKDELVYVEQKELDELPAVQRKLFKEP